MTRQVRIAAILLVLALALIGVKVALTVSHKPSDEVLIRQALSNSLEASRKGESGSVVDLLSQKLKVNQDAAPERAQIAKFIKDSHPDITLANENVLITGDEATIVSPVSLKANFLGQTLDQHFDNVTLIFHREDSRSFFFLPSTAWKLTEVRLPENLNLLESG